MKKMTVNDDFSFDFTEENHSIDWHLQFAELLMFEFV